MNNYKYLIKTFIILGPGALLIWALGGTYVHLTAWVAVMCYMELLEIQDKLKK